MKIIFFGLGSIGQRHAKILLKSYTHDLFAFRSGVNDKKNNLGIKELYSWAEVEKLKPDIAFITNPTYLHIKTAIKCAKIGCKLFIEKPIDKDMDGLDDLLKTVKEKKLITYVAYNLRFHPIIKELKKYIKKEKPLYVRIVCTSFLPDWRPNQDYLKGYSANSDLGGGVILDLSHELDYTTFLLGDINKIECNYYRRSNVTVNAEDFVDYLLETNLSPVNIHINFFSHIHQRYIQIDFRNLTVVADLISTEIKEFSSKSLQRTKKLEYYSGQEYMEQMKYFFDNIDNPEMMNNLSEASFLFKQIVDLKNIKNG